MSEDERIKDLREALRLIDKHGSGSSDLQRIGSQLAEYIRRYKAVRGDQP